jgi:hypothetical protein
MSDRHRSADLIGVSPYETNRLSLAIDLVDGKPNARQRISKSTEISAQGRESVADAASERSDRVIVTLT